MPANEATSPTNATVSPLSDLRRRFRSFNLDRGGLESQYDRRVRLSRIREHSPGTKSVQSRTPDTDLPKSDSPHPSYERGLEKKEWLSSESIQSTPRTEVLASPLRTYQSLPFHHRDTKAPQLKTANSKSDSLATPTVNTCAERPPSFERLLAPPAAVHTTTPTRTSLKSNPLPGRQVILRDGVPLATESVSTESSKERSIPMLFTDLTGAPTVDSGPGGLNVKINTPRALRRVSISQNETQDSFTSLPRVKKTQREMTFSDSEFHTPTNDRDREGLAQLSSATPVGSEGTTKQAESCADCDSLRAHIKFLTLENQNIIKKLRALHMKLQVEKKSLQIEKSMGKRRDEEMENLAEELQGLKLGPPATNNAATQTDSNWPPTSGKPQRSSPRGSDESEQGDFPRSRQLRAKLRSQTDLEPHPVRRSKRARAPPP